MCAFLFVGWFFVSLIGDTGKEGEQEDGGGIGIRVGQTRSEGGQGEGLWGEGGKMEGGTR